MPPRATDWAKWLILVVVVTAIVIPAIFGSPRIVEGETGGDPWRNFIMDFQTLIGGLFAVFAAWWTVSVMQSTDSAAERRHKEQLSLHSREHDAKFRRMLAIVPAGLTQQAKTIRAFEELIPEGHYEPVWTKDAMFKAAHAVNAMRQIKALISNQVLIECRDLYTPTVEEKVGRLEDWATALEAIMGMAVLSIAQIYHVKEATRPEWYEDSLITVLCEMRTGAESLATDLQTWGETMIFRS